LPSAIARRSQARTSRNAFAIPRPRIVRDVVFTFSPRRTQPTTSRLVLIRPERLRRDFVTTFVENIMLEASPPGSA
jgi:hypothetical protein